MSDIGEKLRDWAANVEIALLLPDAGSAMREAADKIERLRAQVAALREALENIIAVESNDWGGDWEEIDKVSSIARAALEGK